MGRCSLVLLALAGCAFEPRGGDETDAARIDAAIADADIDSADIDAPTDAPDLDGPTDSPIDATDAAMIDAPTDAPTDAPADAPTDALTDASIDAPPPIDIAYLPAADEMPGTGNLIVNGNQAINTNVGAVFPNLGAGVTFTVATPTGGGTDIVVMHVDQLTIGPSGVLRVAGTRPFAIVAGGAVIINGSIDLSALGHTIAGAGGFASSTGTGQGTDGRHGGNRTDTGGGGAGHGTVGLRGGNAFCVDGCNPDITINGGEGGALYNAGLTQLVGGSGGGNAVQTAFNCDGQPGGAGGGALLIYSAVSITVASTGIIEAHGGGGGRGVQCSGASTAGAGGGSGGQIDLQSPMVVVIGAVGANGGGGGGGAEGNNADGAPGQDGRNDGMAAAGGAGTGDSGGDGGDGGFATTAPVQGQDLTDDDNGGGGGGAVGHVTVRFRGSMPTIASSPPATYISY